MKNRLLVPWSLLVALLLAPLVSCRSTDPVTGKKVANIYSIQDDIALGRQALAQNNEEMSKKGVPINRDTRTLRKLEDMVRRIAAVSDLPDLPYNVTLYSCDIVNAAAAPGGSIMVFAGLWDPNKGLVRDDAELAAVLGHEIAHVNCRHTTETLTKQQGIAGIGEVLAVIAGSRGGDQAATRVRNAFQIGTALWIPSYSREQEAEADRVGLFYMAKAGYDPRAAPRIWKRAAEHDRSDRTSIFATHPSDSARYSALVALMPEALAVYEQAR
ncbi:MAG TPA: M48 family metallopeptidase [Kiritimatiellia bacterium]|jgi:predicted Zn-dependent protease